MKKYCPIFLSAILAIFSCISAAYAQPGTLSLYAGGTFSGSCTGDGGPATAAGSARIDDIFADRLGNVYIYDGICHNVRKIDHSSGIITTVAGNGSVGYSGDGGPAVAASFGGTLRLAADTAGNLYIADYDNLRIRKVSSATGIVTTVAGGDTATAMGVPATSVALTVISGVHVTPRGDIYFSNGYRLTKVTAATGIIDTVFCASCGGMGIIIGPGVTPIRGDMLGNVYYSDGYNVYKVDTAGNLTVIGGVATLLGYGGASWYSDAQLATRVPMYVTGLCVDDTGNVYISNHDVIQRISHTTGIINTIAGRAVFGTTEYPRHGYYGPISYSADTIPLGDNQICINPAGNIYMNNLSGSWNTVFKLDHPYCNIDTAGVSDSFITPRISIPATIGYGVHGTLTTAPGATDSAHITVYFGDGTSVSRVTPYWRNIVGTDTTYGFGNNYSWMGSHTYNYPGTYNIYYRITTLNGYSIIVGDTPIHVTSTPYTNIYTFEDSTSSYYYGTSYGVYFHDSVITAPCGTPTQMKISVRGWVAGAPLATDTIYYKIHLDPSYGGHDSVLLRKSTISTIPVPYGAWGDTVYAFGYEEVVTYDTNLVSAAYSGVRYGQNQVEVATNNGVVLPAGSVAYSPWPTILGSAWGWVANFTIDDCSAPGHINNSLSVDYSTYYSTPPCTFPYPAVYKTRCELHGAYTSATSDSFRVSFGDGTDTTYRSTSIHTDGMGTYYFADSISHTYTVPGNYYPRIVALGGVTADTNTMTSPTVVSNGCSPISGFFYIDTNANCTNDTSEIKLSHWPYAVINQSRHDTTYGWCDATGAYNITLSVGDTFTIVSNPTGTFGYYGTAGATLAPSCPATGIYTITPAASTAYTNDFAFTCVAATAMDMSVSGWGWGFVPGDTGVIGIWSSNPWGFMCDTLSSDVTLVLDTNLMYRGMWSGPAPTSISGDTLRWHFTTTASLFDFTGYVKVTTDTTATIYDTIRNRLYVAPSRITDPDLTNNTYAWTEPVVSSWDPNEKQVSPKGFGAPGYIPNSTPLSYIIHFQNTGSAAARNIMVNDTISSHLDIGTLQIISSSSSVLAYQYPGNVVKFKFDNINLPDSASDPIGSIGYIAFNIVPFDSLAPGTEIKNTAGIYFDYNPAVYTNTAINTIEDTVGLVFGADTVCTGSSITLTNHISGGAWGATNTHASVSGGVVTGLTPGIDTVTYTVYGHQVAFKVVHVIGAPGAGTISGSHIVCTGGTDTLTASVPGGTWSTTGTGVATVSGAGIVTGITAGTDTIFYAVSNSCGIARLSFAITVGGTMPSAGTITGASTICAGASTTLSSSVTGGIWSHTGSAFASVSSGGIVSGTAAGVDTVYYTVTNTCGSARSSAVVTINTTPSAGTISGAPTVCIGATTTLSASVTGGTWSVSGASIASVAAGVVTGLATGTDTVFYTVTNSCGSAASFTIITVSPLPVAGTLSGTPTVCTGAATTLTSTITGGTWSSSATGVATVVGGVVTGASAGAALISYSVTNSCGTAVATDTITVNPLPSAGVISGSSTVCVGATTTLSSTISGGTWASGSIAVASVTGGVVTGVSVGSAIVTYSVTNGCGTADSMYPVTVITIPVAGTISGLDSICIGDTTTLTSTVTSGSWSSGSTSVANVSASGLVTGLSSGTTMISYTSSNTCGSVSATHPLVVRLAIDCPTEVGTVKGAGVGTVSIFPNPNTGLFTINIPAHENEVSITILDVHGRAVKTITITNKAQLDIPVDLSKVAVGVYMIKAEVDGAVYYRKVVVM